MDISKPQTQTIDITMVLRGGREVWERRHRDAGVGARRYQILDLVADSATRVDLTAEHPSRAA
ncbi:MAG: hypothetical protein KF705_00945 [Phycisphaeraceae bacterium]|nr:hypothetical protein [Phycisphaeraceae bacterium]